MPSLLFLCDSGNRCYTCVTRARFTGPVSVLWSHMSSFRKLLWTLGLFLTSSSLFARYVFVLPLPGQASTVTVYGADPISLVTSFPTIVNAFTVLTNPQGSRAWVVSTSGEVQVINLENQFQEIGRYRLGGSISRATLTPDGRYLLALSGRLRIISTTVDIPTSGIVDADAGLQPEDVAVSIDSTTAFVTSAASRQLTVIAIPSGNRLGSQTFQQTPTGVAVGPNGLVYVTAPGRLFELDYRDNAIQFTNANGFTFDANPTRAAFTPDGRRAVVLNTEAGATVGLVGVDLAARSVSTANAAGVQLSRPLVVSNSTGFTVGNQQLLAYSLSPFGSPGPAAVGIPEGIVAVTASQELPQARFLYAVLSNSVYRFDLVSPGTTSPQSFSSPAGGIAFSAVAATGSVATLSSTTLDLQVGLNATSLPVVVRALDSQGRPVWNANVSFTAVSQGLTLSAGSATTNLDGLASIRAVLPATPGTYVVRVQSGGAPAVEIPIRAAAVPQVGQTQLTIAGGNGQIIAAGSVSQAFQVRLRDALGNPVVNANVNWTKRIGQSIGFDLTATTSTTDSNGVAQVAVTTGTFTPTAGDTVRPIGVTATVNTGTFAGSVDLFGVIYPNSQPAPLFSFANNLGGTGGVLLLPAGATLTSAFSATLNAAVTGLPVPIPNVGIRAFFDPTNGGPTAQCRNNPISSAAGTVTCDLVVGSTISSGNLNVIVGENPLYTFSFPARVVAGVPAAINIVQGNNQSGLPGATTPRALVVQVVDALGNLLGNVPITWSVTGDGRLTGVSCAAT